MSFSRHEFCHPAGIQAPCSETMTNSPKHKRPPKKTVSLEVRVSEDDKSAFMAACRSANRSASAALRDLMGLFVVIQRTRTRMLEMLKSLLIRPVRAATAALATTLAASAGLLLAPTASADMQLAYQVIVDDGVGQIVSMGETSTGNEPVSDTLGQDIRFELVAVSCGEDTAMGCEAGELRLTVGESQNGETVREFVHGVGVAETGQTRFETGLMNGRTLVVYVVPKV